MYLPLLMDIRKTKLGGYRKGQLDCFYSTCGNLELSRVTRMIYKCRMARERKSKTESLLLITLYKRTFKAIALARSK